MRKQALTLPPKRLAGSPACLNCGTLLQGPFCHYCGQPDKNLIRFFPVLVRDLLADFLDFDSRFMRTMKPLLLHPGRLTRDYLEGRRFRYTPPMRLYIFASMAFFILAAMLAGDAIDLKSSDGGGLDINLGSEVREEVSAELDQQVQSGDLDAAEARRIEKTLRLGNEGAEAESASGDEPAEPEEDAMMINGKPWDRETNPFVLPGMPDFVNDWINDEIGESPQKGREIEANPNLIVDKMFDVLPLTVFIALPLVALLFKFWYLFARRYYVEHLIHALHNHAFLFVVFMLALIANSAAGWLDPEGGGQPSRIFNAVVVVLYCWVPLYLLISLRTVYRQGWPMTLAKFSVIGISYVVLLLLVAAVAAILSFVLL